MAPKYDPCSMFADAWMELKTITYSVQETLLLLFARIPFVYKIRNCIFFQVLYNQEAAKIE